MDHSASILIVDDDSSVQLLLRNELTEQRYRVVVAASSAEALKAFEAQRFHVALIDVILGQSDSGVDLLREVRRRRLEVEVILMSGYPNLGSTLEAIEFGIFDYLTKPFDHLGGVVQRVRRAVERRHNAEQLTRLVCELGESFRSMASTVQSMEQSYLHTARVLCELAGIGSAVLSAPSRRELSLAVADVLGLDRNSLEWLGLAAWILDLAKDRCRPPPPFSNEMLAPGARIESELVAALNGFPPLAEILRHRQERFDGNGEAGAPAGTRIPLSSRILGVVDEFVHLRESTPGTAHSSPLAVLEQRSGNELDPRVVKALVQVMVAREGVAAAGAVGQKGQQ